MAGVFFFFFSGVAAWFKTYILGETAIVQQVNYLHGNLRVPPPMPPPPGNKALLSDY